MRSTREPGFSCVPKVSFTPAKSQTVAGNESLRDSEGGMRSQCVTIRLLWVKRLTVFEGVKREGAGSVCNTQELQSAGEVPGVLPLLKGAGREVLTSVIRRKGI